jgi:membrane fusion protein (multidrug efflux system)
MITDTRLSVNRTEFRIYLLIAFLLFVLNACERQDSSVQPLPVTVTTQKIISKTIPNDFEYVGVAESSHLVQIRARVEGYLDKIAYQEGEMVEVDELLFQLDPRPFVASLDEAKGVLAKQIAVHWDAKQSLDRLKPLYEKNAASKRDLDNATSREMSSNAEVLTAQAQVAQAELNLSFTTIKSPIKGMSNRSIYRVGDLITPGPNGLLTSLYVIDPIWVNFSVAESDILQSRTDTHLGSLVFPENMNFDIEVILSDGTRLPSQGVVNFADPALQQSTGTMNIRAILPNPHNLLRPGQFVRVVVKGAIRPNAITVPQKAVMQGQQGMFVYVVTPEGIVEQRLVTAGNWYKNSWVIKSGLKAGEEVVIDGINKIQPGAKVITKAYIEPAQ